MKKLPPTLARVCIAAGLLAAVAAAQAASGFTVQPRQESLVVPGMDSTAVLQALGRPALQRSFHNEPGPTWTYRLAGSEATLFDVDFDADGKVASVSERMDEGGRATGGPR